MYDPAKGFPRLVPCVFYADPAEGGRLSYSQFYDEYQHSGADLTLDLIARGGPIETKEGLLKGRLFLVR